jgi:hypothetical protein
MSTSSSLSRVSAIISSYYGIETAASKPIADNRELPNFLHLSLNELRAIRERIARESDRIENQQTDCYYSQYLVFRNGLDRLRYIEYLETEAKDSVDLGIISIGSACSSMLSLSATRPDSMKDAGRELRLIEKIEKLKLSIDMVKICIKANKFREAVSLAKSLSDGIPEGFLKYKVFREWRSDLHLEMVGMIDPVLSTLRDSFETDLPKILELMNRIFELIKSESIFNEAIERILAVRDKWVLEILFATGDVLEAIHSSSDLLIWTWSEIKQRVEAADDKLLNRVIPRVIIEKGKIEEMMAWFTETTDPNVNQVTVNLIHKSVKSVMFENAEICNRIGSLLVHFLVSTPSLSPRDAFGGVIDAINQQSREQEDPFIILEYFQYEKSLIETQFPSIQRLVMTTRTGDLVSDIDIDLTTTECWNTYVERWVQKIKRIMRERTDLVGMIDELDRVLKQLRESSLIADKDVVDFRVGEQDDGKCSETLEIFSLGIQEGLIDESETVKAEILKHFPYKYLVHKLHL